MKKVTFTRRKLYELVWSEPMLSISKKYKISDVGLRKICIKMNIPIPPRGYWQKVRYGKKVKMKKLPESYSGEDTITFFEGDKNTKQSQLNTLVNEITGDPSLPLSVPKRLTNPDKLIVSARKSLSDKKPRWYEPLIRPDFSELNIKVAPENVSRALRLMDTFIKLVRARGHNLKVEYGRTTVTVSGVDTEILLRERLKVVKNPDGNGSRKLQPTGKLVF
jgi:hypothetical protein